MNKVTPIDAGTVSEALARGSSTDQADALHRLLGHPAGRRLTLGWFQRIMRDEFGGVGGNVKSTLPLQHAKAIYTPTAAPDGASKVRDPYEQGAFVTSVYPEGTIWREENEPAPREPRESDVEALAKVVMGDPLPERTELIDATVLSAPAVGADGAFLALIANMPDVASVYDPISPQS